MTRFSFGTQRFAVHRAPVPHVIVDGVFGEEARAAIFAELAALRDRFAPATIGAESRLDRDFRRHAVLSADAHYFDPAGPADFEARIRARAERSALLGAVDSLVMDAALRDVLDSAPFPICKLREVDRWETQVAWYDDGDHYAWHIDRLGDDARLLSIVYYAHPEPRRFSGGELELTDALVHGGALLSTGSSVRVEPRGDRAVIFGARTAHRVLPTRGGGELDARVAVNVFCGIADGVAGDRVY